MSAYITKIVYKSYASSSWRIIDDSRAVKAKPWTKDNNVKTFIQVNDRKTLQTVIKNTTYYLRCIIGKTFSIREGLNLKL